MPGQDNYSQAKDVIENAFENRADITPTNTEPEVRKAVQETLNQVDSGKFRVAEKQGGDWITNEWIKKAVLLSFRMNENEIIDTGVTKYFDKVPTKFSKMSDEQIKKQGARIVPGAMVRHGAFIAPDAILMPSLSLIHI